MLKLPSKKWRKVRFKYEGEKRYILFFDSPVPDAGEMREIIEEDIEMCLGKKDHLVSWHWETKSVLLEISEYEPFIQRLLDANIITVE